MMRRAVLFLMLISLFSLAYVASAQDSRLVTQTSSPITTQSSKWTEARQRALLDRALRGESESQFWLGAAYGQGWFGKANVQEALKWYRKAAAQGDPDAQNALGQMYEGGEGVKQNYALAARWYRRAAEHVPNLGGAGQGRNNLGLLYLDGHGVPRDVLQAYKWFRLAHADANTSHAKSQMTEAQLVEAERLTEEWKAHHPEK